MFVVESYAAVRRSVFVEGHSRREASRVFGLSRETVSKMCRFSLPPGYTRTKPVGKPKLGMLLPVIDEILMSDQTGPVKQRHSAKRIFERLRDEHGFGGGYTVVKGLSGFADLRVERRSFRYRILRDMLRSTLARRSPSSAACARRYISSEWISRNRMHVS
jgi:hypothetical protein